MLAPEKLLQRAHGIESSNPIRLLHKSVGMFIRSGTHTKQLKPPPENCKSPGLLYLKSCMNRRSIEILKSLSVLPTEAIDERILSRNYKSIL